MESLTSISLPLLVLLLDPQIAFLTVNQSKAAKYNNLSIYIYIYIYICLCVEIMDIHLHMTLCMFIHRSFRFWQAENESHGHDNLVPLTWKVVYNKVTLMSFSFYTTHVSSISFPSWTPLLAIFFEGDLLVCSLLWEKERKIQQRRSVFHHDPSSCDIFWGWLIY